MKIVSAHKSDIGRVYQHNDDYIWVDDNLGLYIVADGMGGNEAGDVASKMTAHSVGSTLVEQLTADQSALTSMRIKELLVDAIEAANRAVYQAAIEAQQKRKMGTTIVAALIQSTKLYVSHAGDSRVYLARGTELRQLTEDDSWGAQFGPGSLKKKRQQNKP